MLVVSNPHPLLLDVIFLQDIQIYLFGHLTLSFIFGPFLGFDQVKQICSSDGNCAIG